MSSGDTVRGSWRVSRLCCAPAAPTVVDGQMFPNGVFLFWSQLCPSHTNAARSVGEPQYSRWRGGQEVPLVFEHHTSAMSMTSQPCFPDIHTRPSCLVPSDPLLYESYQFLGLPSHVHILYETSAFGILFTCSYLIEGTMLWPSSLRGEPACSQLVA